LCNLEIKIGSDKEGNNRGLKGDIPVVTLGNRQCTDIPSEDSHYAARELDLSNSQECQCTDLHLYQAENLTV